MAHYVTGVFSEIPIAEKAVNDLVEGHFDPDQISILVKDHEGTHREGVEHDTGVAEGAVAGGAIGSILGAVGATLVATGVFSGPVGLLATGPIVAAIQGALAGGTAGMGFGALTGLGFWEDEAHVHAEALEKGGIVIAVPAEHEHAEDARRIFENAGADAVRG